MKANQEFRNKDIAFWANIRAFSEKIGYTKRKDRKVLVFNEDDIKDSIKFLNLKLDLYFKENGQPTDLTESIIRYSQYRADCLNNIVQYNLLNKNSAKDLYQELKTKYNPSCPQPMNKQSGDKKDIAFFTAMINILLEANLNNEKIDYDPRSLVKIIHNKELTHTLSRRVDGAFPNTSSPIAIWEIKEYYYTTTFGSRIADGVYETQLDGFELEEVHSKKNIEVLHYLFIDDYNTWWEMGRSYLCRIIDMLHMNKVDEVVFGKEIIEAIPRLCQEWLRIKNNYLKEKIHDYYES